MPPRTPKVARDHRKIQLKQESRMHLVADDKLRDRAVEVLVLRIGNLFTVILQCSEVSELLCNTEP